VVCAIRKTSAIMINLDTKISGATRPIESEI